jgi:hypothetical protein
MSKKIDTDVAALRTEFGTLKTQVETTADPNQGRRNLATGGDGATVKTDC